MYVSFSRSLYNVYGVSIFSSEFTSFKSILYIPNFSLAVRFNCARVVTYVEWGSACLGSWAACAVSGRAAWVAVVHSDPLRPLCSFCWSACHLSVPCPISFVRWRPRCSGPLFLLSAGPPDILRPFCYVPGTRL